MNSFKSFIYIFLAFGIFSCVEKDEYRVASEFENYVIAFENEAKKHNKLFNLKSTGLIIEFANLKDNQAGLCHYETPIRIEIDQEYWDKLKGKSGEVIMKENLIFHELGHGILNRRHINTTLENGDWKSMMCGGDKVNDRPWNINYRGIRREYYINELFNESTEKPSISSLELKIDTSVLSQRKVYLSFDSESKADAGWDVSNNVGYKISIDNKRLLFESKITNSYHIFAVTSVDVKNDFAFEIKFQCQSVEKSDAFGLVFGNKEIGNQAVEFFSINNDAKMYMGNRGWYSFYTELSVPIVVPNGINKLKIVKISNKLHYFINDKYVYNTESEIFESGNNFGFIVPSKSKLWLDDMKISVSKTASNVIKKSNSSISDFTIMEVNDSFNLVPNY